MNFAEQASSLFCLGKEAVNANPQKTQYQGGSAMSEQPLTIDELAEYLRVKKSWIYSRTRIKGPDVIPHTRVGKYLRFYLLKVLPWLQERGGDQE